MASPPALLLGALATRLLGHTWQAADWMRCELRLAVIPGAARLHRAGVLDAITALDLDRFTDRLLQPVPGAV
ncbi:hypothetical protein AB0E25_39640 [Streptomyces bobili]|uniref:hypothetical protein n=1 Tax=Streptomyces bobili TaxID=67280 RepID=UPI00340E46B2